MWCYVQPFSFLQIPKLETGDWAKLWGSSSGLAWSPLWCWPCYLYNWNVIAVTSTGGKECHGVVKVFFRRISSLRTSTQNQLLQSVRLINGHFIRNISQTHHIGTLVKITKSASNSWRPFFKKILAISSIGCWEFHPSCCKHFLTGRQKLLLSTVASYRGLVMSAIAIDGQKSYYRKQ